MSEHPTPREVIAHIVDMGSNDADAILAALTAAGYTICERQSNRRRVIAPIVDALMTLWAAAEQALVLANQDAEGWRKDAERLARVLRAEGREIPSIVERAQQQALAAHDLRVAQP